MSYRNWILPLALAGLCIAVPMAYRIETDAASGYTFAARVYGPGVDNLSASDPYARYQWGLRNDG